MLPILRTAEELERVYSRSQLDFDKVNTSVKEIITSVRECGDSALWQYTAKFDKITIDSDNAMVSSAEIEWAYSQVSTDLLASLRRAKANIELYNKRNMRKDSIFTSDGKTTGFMIRAVERVGIYVPGGKATYPSSVLMCAVPAYVAGVKEIIMCTPCGGGLNALTIVAGVECGVKKIFKIGGAQAIGAMAYGTATVPKVDVISGPGNIYVAMAKKEVYGVVGIDMIAGPSEILIVADKTAQPKAVCCDLLSQAEHDELAMSVLITDSEELAQKVNIELEDRCKKLPKSAIAGQSLARYGAIVVVKNIADGIEIANKIAPEHLELCVEDPESYLPLVMNAGAVFLGHDSPEPLGDYYAGTNHVLPTSGTAKFFSSLSTDNYIKKISVVKYDKSSLREAKDDIIALAESEGLQAHANSLRVRFEEK